MNKKVLYPLIAVLVVILAVVIVLNAPTKAPSANLPADGQAADRETVPEGSQVYDIQADASKAEFRLDEDLRGTHVTVVGTNASVAGRVVFNPSDVAATQFSPITVNARTFVTDSEQRNDAIRRFILKTEDDANEFITFYAKTDGAIEGAPASVQPGQAFSFKLHGDLTVSGVTKPETFDVTATLGADGKLTGTATTKFLYGDFNLAVPDFPFLANVEKELEVKVDFTAAP